MKKKTKDGLRRAAVMAFMLVLLLIVLTPFFLMILTSLKSLPEREVQVVSLYYYEGLTLKEIGRILGVTESRVSQIHGKALASLRAFLVLRE